MRIVTVSVFGQPARRLDQNDGRERLLSWVVDRAAAAAWGPLDVMLLPAGYLFGELVLGPLGHVERARLIEDSPVGAILRRAGFRLFNTAGGLLVTGLDTRSYLKGFRGDQMMIATNGDAIIGAARKVLASPIDARAAAGQRYLIFGHDADEEGRVIKLPNGQAAVLCSCYDAFAFGRRAADLGSNRPFTAAGKATRRLSRLETGALTERFRRALLAAGADAALVGIHGFDAPGRETRWQRHGIASASAALGGGLAVGAAHFTEWLPDPSDLEHATLASKGVGRRHLGQGLHRRARKAAAIDSIYVTVPGSSTLAATVRLFES